MLTLNWQTSSTMLLTESADPGQVVVRTTPEAFAALVRHAKQARGR